MDAVNESATKGKTQLEGLLTSGSNEDGPDLTPGLVPMRKRPSRAAIGVVALVAGIADGFFVRADNVTFAQILVSAAFMSVFVYVVLRAITKVRFNVRPEAGDPLTRDPSLPPLAGGWANPTRGQRGLQRIKRLRGPSRR